MSPIAFDPFFEATIERGAACLNQMGIGWMVFGGAAMVLHGHNEANLADIDIVVTKAGASTLSKRFTWPNYADSRSDRFRSDYLLRPEFGLIPVEIMGGFQILTERGWTAVQPRDTQEIRVGSQVAHVPSKERLAEIFRLCGRPKDILRADRLSSR